MDFQTRLAVRVAAIEPFHVMDVQTAARAGDGRTQRHPLERAGVALTPGIDFGVHRARQHVRLAYTIDPRKLEEGMSRLRDFLSRT